MAGTVQQLCSGGLELGEVVVRHPHLGAQFGVRAARLLGGGCAFAVQPLDLLVQAQDRAQSLVGGALGDADRLDAERLEHRPALRSLDSDFERGSFARRLLGEQIVDRRPQCRGDRAQHRQAGFALAVLDCRELRGRAVDR